MISPSTFRNEQKLKVYNYFSLQIKIMLNTSGLNWTPSTSISNLVKACTLQEATQCWCFIQERFKFL